MNCYLIGLLLICLSGCTTIKTPSDYSKQRLSEDSVSWEYDARDDFMSLPDGGSTFKSRNMNIIGAEF
jgi:hypothetical protein